MQIKTKEQLKDRLQLAKDIVVNIKDDCKLLASRSENIDDKIENLFIADKACDIAILLCKLQLAVLTVEEVTKGE